MIVENVDLEKYNCLTVHAVDKWGLVMRRDAELADHDFIEPKDLINEPIMISRQALAADLPKWMGDDISRVNVCCVAARPAVYESRERVSGRDEARL